MNNINVFVPLIIYINANTNKSIIYKDNENKSGIYSWNNLITGKCYVGSAINIPRRLSNYFSISYLESKKKNSIIYSAILKYGYSNFSLNILEHCSKENLINREQYYIDKIKPEYNILKIAGSVLGLKHSEATKAKMRNNNLGKKLTYETRQKIGLSLKLAVKANIKPKLMTVDTKLKLSSRSRGVSLKVFDLENNLINIFPTLSSAAKYFKVSHRTLNKIPNMGVYDRSFIFKFELKDLRVWIYDSSHNLLMISNNAKKAAEWCNIPSSTMDDYIKYSKLYKNKYYFYTTKSNPYIRNND